MRYPFPDRTLFEGLPSVWSAERFGNEHGGFHDAVIRCALSRKNNQLLPFIVKVAPRPVEVLLKLADRSPFYRLIVGGSKKAQGGGDAAC